MLDEARLAANAAILDSVQQRTGARILLALKGFAAWDSFPLLSRAKGHGPLWGTCASSVDEALLGREEFGGEVHAFAAGWTEEELDELLRMVDYYKSGKPAADKLKSIRFEKSRQKYKSEHDDELRTFYMAERKLKSYFKDGKLPITAWRREREQLEQEYKDIQTELSPLHADAKKLWAIHYNIYEVQHEQERQNAATRQKKQEIEH